MKRNKVGGIHDSISRNKQKQNVDGIIKIIQNKNIIIQDIIRNTILSISHNKAEEIFSNNDSILSISILTDLYERTTNIHDNLFNMKTTPTDDIIVSLQKVIDKLSMVICGFGTNYIEDLLFISFGSEFKNTQQHNSMLQSKYDLIQQYVRPTGYKIVQWSKKKKAHTHTNITCENKITEDNIDIENHNTLECFNIESGTESFTQNVYGLRIIMHNEKARKTLIITGVIEDMHIECISNDYISTRLEELNSLTIGRAPSEKELIQNIISTITLKDILIYGNDDIIKKMIILLTDVKSIKENKIEKTIQMFLEMDKYSQRNMLMNLLMFDNDNDIQYISYLLYEVLSVESADNGKNDQRIIYNSLPWKIKTNFKEVIKETIQSANEMMNKYDINQISLEQQIYLMKADEKIKEKAILKLKEIKGKPDEMGLKAKQYIEGLLKIPFNIYREEPSLKQIKLINTWIIRIISIIKSLFPEFNIVEKDTYTLLEIDNNIAFIRRFVRKNILHTIKRLSDTLNIKQLNLLVQKINTYKKTKKEMRLTIANQTKSAQVSKLCNFITEVMDTDDVILYELFDMVSSDSTLSLINVKSELRLLNTNITKVQDNITNIMNVLDESIYGHTHAKNQIMKVIGQWMSGEQSGYCFGFEGNPGIGKCLAKNTPVMLYDGKIKLVQDITITDKLMGDDSNPRNILALGRGKERMYRIEQTKGDDYVVNESHILSLKMTKPQTKGDRHQTILGRRYYKNDIVDICVRDYLSIPKYLQDCLKGYKVGLSFDDQTVSLEPYALGYWLGDGDKTTFRITTNEKEVIEYFTQYATMYNLQLTKNHTSYHITTGKKGGYKDRNSLLNMLRQYNLLGNKHIPPEYQLNSREKRLDLLAGLIDSDGHYSLSSNSFEITHKNQDLANDILFLARSLGMRGTMKECKKSCIYKGEKRYGIYCRIIITGEGLQDIPVKCPRKKARKHNQIKNCLNTGIKVIPLEKDEYYGFQIDGNSRFLLGDFTVTHNTSLSKKGLSLCLKDDNGEPRPFSFIALGGSCNGSTLEGHSYTYMNSTWGRIVDILMESKCMNPIIYIDELDKVSKTENGREIIGIFTHLIDQTQNDSFQDKYFSGIDIDLSKALFIFSYNDPEQIDKVLLDRIHRIKFENLTTPEKVVIVNRFILPEINKKMGFNNVVVLDDNMIEYIIDKYTMEPGVRKLKELLFDLYGEINLDLLKNTNKELELPIKITDDILETKYLSKYHKITEKKIHSSPIIGIINGLWANSLGRGGIIPIQTMLYPSSIFLELRLTGLQGDVMKESMNVAKSLAWNLTPNSTKKKLITQFSETKCQGLHIHCPEGSTSKDGPSAGSAITTAIYSLFNNKKIDNTIAITGEINLQGEVTAIGGLDMKIAGGIKAGVKTFIYPKENYREYRDWINKNEESLYKNIKFHEVSTIQDVFKIIFT